LNRCLKVYRAPRRGPVRAANTERLSQPLASAIKCAFLAQSIAMVASLRHCSALRLYSSAGTIEGSHGVVTRHYRDNAARPQSFQRAAKVPPFRAQPGMHAADGAARMRVVSRFASR
jgi:hypothetical protein